MTDHNEEFLGDPTGHLVAIIDATADAESAETELTSAGFRDLHVYRGQQGAESIDSSGTEHGAGGGVIRGIQQLFSNKDNLAEYELAVRMGRTVIAVEVDGGEARDRAEAILEGRGAHAVNHFGIAVVRTMKA
jgi:hypothetical protein